MSPTRSSGCGQEPRSRSYEARGRRLELLHVAAQNSQASKRQAGVEQIQAASRQFRRENSSASASTGAKSILPSWSGIFFNGSKRVCAVTLTYFQKGCRPK